MADNIYMWIVYCEEKNRKLKSDKTRKTSFDEIIQEIMEENFIIVNNTSKYHKEQKCFVVEINRYPIVCPFNYRNEVVQLITFFPDRRYK